MSRASAARGPLRGASTPILIGVLVAAAGAVGALIIPAAMTTRRVRPQMAKGRECLGWCTVPPFLQGNVLQCVVAVSPAPYHTPSQESCLAVALRRMRHPEEEEKQH